MITLIAAVAKNGVIGNENAIPWHLPEDFKHFSATTREHVVIMGSKTWDSLPEKFRPLPKRINVVLSSQDRTFEGAMRFTNLDAALHYAEDRSKALEVREFFVIGGASLYAATIARADKLIISEVDMEPEGDTFFPKIGPEWVVSDRDEREGFTITTYKRG
jgi:dihydrofolate reductase